MSRSRLQESGAKLADSSISSGADHGRTQVWITWAWWVLLLTMLVGFTFVYVTRPELRPSLVKEDRFLESLTPGIFAAAVLIGLLHFRRVARWSWSRWHLLLPLLSLVGVLDELSFGERMFDLTMPTVAGYKVDAIHDVLDFLPRWYQTLLWLTGITTVLAIVFRKTRLVSDSKYRDSLLLNAARRCMAYPLRVYPAVCFGLGLTALAFDADAKLAERTILGVPEFLRFLEELFETGVALTMCGWTVASLCHRPRQCEGTGFTRRS